jgi:hypothetical protein
MEQSSEEMDKTDSLQEEHGAAQQGTLGDAIGNFLKQCVSQVINFSYYFLYYLKIWILYQY